MQNLAPAASSPTCQGSSPCSSRSLGSAGAGSRRNTSSRYSRRGHEVTVCASLQPLSSNTIPRIVDSIPRRGPQPGWPHFPEVVLRDAQTLQHDLSPDQVGWPVLVFAAIAIAITVEAAQISLDKLRGTTRESRSERREVQQAARRAANSDSSAMPNEAHKNWDVPECSSGNKELAVTSELLLGQDPELAYRRQLLADDRLAERRRGLLWLTGFTLATLWIAGCFEPDTSHPYIF